MARHAAFTIVQDDPVNLRIWADYYRKTYAAADAYVVHHPRVGELAHPPWLLDVRAGVTADDSASYVKGFQLIDVFRAESFNHTWLRETVQHFQRFLLQSYDTVLFTEVDEIVAPDPTATDLTLREFVEAFADSADPHVRCTGHEVVHDYACEPPIDHDAPLLAQRTYWYPSAQYSKTLLAKVPMTWVNGFHEPDPAAPPGANRLLLPRLDLLLLHLHKLDFGHALERHRRSAARKWAQYDKDTAQGYQNQVADEAWLRDWWLNTVDTPGERARWSRMPAAVKEIL